MQLKHRARQVSDSLLVGCLLSISGGMQDAYTYRVRGEVFANAQTGNIVLMGESIAHRHWAQAVQYLLPLLAFALGIFAAEFIRNRFPSRRHAVMHWRHGVLLAEVTVLAAVAWMPQSWNPAANVLVSFVCAMQVQSFRKVEGNAYATTMCIGNLRSAMENLYYWTHDKDAARRHKAVLYFMVIFCFLIGAAAEGVLSLWCAEHTILMCCPLLLLAFALMLRIRIRFPSVGEDSESSVL